MKLDEFIKERRYDTYQVEVPNKRPLKTHIIYLIWFIIGLDLVAWGGALDYGIYALGLIICMMTVIIWIDGLQKTIYKTYESEEEWHNLRYTHLKDYKNYLEELKLLEEIEEYNK